MILQGCANCEAISEYYYKSDAEIFPQAAVPVWGNIDKQSKKEETHSWK